MSVAAGRELLKIATKTQGSPSFAWASNKVRPTSEVTLLSLQLIPHLKKKEKKKKSASHWGSTLGFGKSSFVCVVAFSLN